MARDDQRHGIGRHHLSHGSCSGRTPRQSGQFPVTHRAAERNGPQLLHDLPLEGCGPDGCHRDIGKIIRSTAEILTQPFPQFGRPVVFLRMRIDGIDRRRQRTCGRITDERA